MLQAGALLGTVEQKATLKGIDMALFLYPLPDRGKEDEDAGTGKEDGEKALVVVLCCVVLCVDLRFSGIFLTRYQSQGHVPHHPIRLIGLACDCPDSHRGMVTPTRALWSGRLLDRSIRRIG